MKPAIAAVLLGLMSGIRGILRGCIGGRWVFAPWRQHHPPNLVRIRGIFRQRRPIRSGVRQLRDQPRHHSWRHCADFWEESLYFRCEFESEAVRALRSEPAPIPDGIAVNLFINLTTDAAPGVSPLHLSNIVGATQAGEYAPVDGADGLISAQQSGPVTQLWPAGVLNAATLLPGAIAPGEIVTLMGAGIGATPAQANVQLAFEGLPAPILYAGPSQINAVVPYGVSGTDSAHLQLTTADQDIAEFDLPVVEAAPGIFTLDASGIGPGAILNQDLTVNTPSNPAEPGSLITLFAHGAGQTDPPGIDGQIPADILPKPILPVSVQIAGLDAPVQYEGAAPGMIAGVLQVNCVVPPGAPSGYSVPIVLAVGQTASQNGVTLAIK